jgi:hypothetical protein
MRITAWLIFASLFILSCQDPCNESECRGGSAIFTFRLLDEAGNDVVFQLNRINPDSVFALGSNENAISTLPRELSIKELTTESDTFNVFQFAVDNVHFRYLLQTRTADTTITDTLRTDYILENSDCCGVELIEYDATLNGNDLCEGCRPEQIHVLLR